jgi:transcriptional regulator EpsA
MEVRRRNQFYLWAQGHLQSLIPHEVLICAYGDRVRKQLSVEHFSSYPLPDQDVESMQNAERGLMAHSISVWTERGEKPLLVCGSDRSSTMYRRFEGILGQYAFPNLIVHGMPVLNGAPNSYFVFANMPQPLSERQGYVVSILIPYVHLAFLRMLAGERSEVMSESLVHDRIVTEREVEILAWVREGKSNLEIGSILSISPLTVKNHVQKILKKLNAQNRAQAVAKALSLQLIRNDVEH